MENPWRYFGKRWDSETATYYFGKRYYDPDIARRLSTDPLGFVDSTNLYQYVFNNPFSYADPHGEFAIAIPLLIWGAELAAPTLYTIGYAAFRKNADVYVPDRPIPQTKDEEPILESDGPHTQLGVRKGKYPKAREFDKDGNKVRDIDFTDHGSPDIHPLPHEHRWKDNPTGGSKIRDDPKPVKGWNY